MLLFSLPVAICMPQFPPLLIGPLVAKMVSPGILRCHFVHRLARQFFSHSRDHLDQSVLNVLILVLYVYPEPSNCCSKMQKQFTRSYLAPETGRNISNSFIVALKGDCSAQYRPRAKISMVKSSDNKGSEYVKKNIYQHVCE